MQCLRNDFKAAYLCFVKLFKNNTSIYEANKFLNWMTEDFGIMARFLHPVVSSEFSAIRRLLRGRFRRVQDRRFRSAIVRNNEPLGLQLAKHKQVTSEQRRCPNYISLRSLPLHLFPIPVSRCTSL